METLNMNTLTNKLIWNDLMALYGTYLAACVKSGLSTTHYRASFGYCCYQAFNDVKFLGYLLETYFYE